MLHHSFSSAYWLELIPAYLLGSLSFAVLFSRIFGLADPRSYGSGNPGATNVLRSGHKSAALFTLVFDALKGALPVWWAMQVAPGQDAWILGLGLAAFCGHLWPILFKFKGGKGVATAAGILLGLSLPLLGACLLLWLGVVALTRYVSLASVSVALLAPLIAWLLGLPAVWAQGLLIMGALLVWRHRANIAKLRAGTESRLGQKVAPKE